MIKFEPPPNYERIQKAFKLNGREIFAYDGVIYSPGKGLITPELIAHESVHFNQQKEVGVEDWWDYYIKDKEFRLAQELPAHLVEYAEFVKRHKDRNERARYLEFVSSRLSSDLYGKVVTKQQAVKLIKNYGN